MTSSSIGTSGRSEQPLPPLEVGDELPPASVTAHNNSLNSTNKIHDDDVARTYGFKGGLVPGVTVYAYAVAPLAAQLGVRWLTGGEATIAFINPLYEGERAVSHATVTALESTSRGERVVLDVRTENPTGQRCATGIASVLRDGTPEQPPVPDYVAALRRPLPEPRPELFLETAPVGEVLALLEVRTSVTDAREYARMVFSENPLFLEGSPWGPPLMHPGWLLSECNRIFGSNYVFGPWIHTKSEIRYLGPAIAGDTFTFRGRLAEAFERRGHHYAVLDIFCVGDGEQPVMQVRHTAIFKVHPRN
jgi:acyl dehydratase